MSFNKYLLLLLMLGCEACTKKVEFKTIGDDKLAIEAVKKEQDGGYVYVVKILIKEKGLNLSNEMFYKMDSCIYMEEGTSKMYPLGITPIANGTSNSFEYMVYFDRDDFVKSMLVYKDKFINQKEYKLSFK